MITSYGYAVKRDGKFLGCVKKTDKDGRFYLKRFYKSPRYPVIGGFKYAMTKAYQHLGEIVKVKLTMEEVSDGK